MSQKKEVRILKAVYMALGIISMFLGLRAYRQLAQQGHFPKRGDTVSQRFKKIALLPIRQGLLSWRQYWPLYALILGFRVLIDNLDDA
jgi:hypothetical protein